jgi:O-antigen ligase
MKLHRLIFFFLFAVAPFQLAYHFWPSSSLVLGLRVDYLSPTVFATDIVILFLLLSWCWQERSTLFPFRPKKQTVLICTLLAAVFLLNLLFSRNRPTSAYKLIKILEFILLIIYIKKEITLPKLFLPLSFTVIFSALLAIGQFYFQHSFGGLLWWLGERPLSLNQPGVAKAIVHGHLILRPYATFPHPNALSGFLLVVLILLFYWYKARTKSLPFFLVFFLGLITIAISFSRSVWILSLFVFPFLLMTHYTTFGEKWLNDFFGKIFDAKTGFLSHKASFSKTRIRFLSLFTFSPFIYLLLIPLFLLAYFILKLPFSNSEPFDQRLFLNGVALDLIRKNPIFGVGLNNFIVYLPDYWRAGQTFLLQPVHNIFLLITAETGAITLLLFLYLLIKCYSKLIENIRSVDASSDSLLLLIALSSILVLGLFDHYWITLQQNILLFSLVIGLSLSSRPVNK